MPTFVQGREKRGRGIHKRYWCRHPAGKPRQNFRTFFLDQNGKERRRTWSFSRLRHYFETWGADTCSKRGGEGDLFHDRVRYRGLRDMFYTRMLNRSGRLRFTSNLTVFSYEQFLVLSENLRTQNSLILKSRF